LERKRQCFQAFGHKYPLGRVSSNCLTQNTPGVKFVSEHQKGPAPLKNQGYYGLCLTNSRTSKVKTLKR
jgi:hypothetical protein